jgi:hypothetical protein
MQYCSYVINLKNMQCLFLMKRAEPRFLLEETIMFVYIHNAAREICNFLVVWFSKTLYAVFQESATYTCTVSMTSLWCGL